MKTNKMIIEKKEVLQELINTPVFMLHCFQVI